MLGKHLAKARFLHRYPRKEGKTAWRNLILSAACCWAARSAAYAATVSSPATPGETGLHSAACGKRRLSAWRITGRSGGRMTCCCTAWVWSAAALSLTGRGFSRSRRGLTTRPSRMCGRKSCICGRWACVLRLCCRNAVTLLGFSGWAAGQRRKMCIISCAMWKRSCARWDILWRITFPSGSRICMPGTAGTAACGRRG